MRGAIGLPRKARKRFYDKNGTLIRLGDKLSVPDKNKFLYKDLVVRSKDEKLGILFVHNDFFIPLDLMPDHFFKNCEIIITTEI